MLRSGFRQHGLPFMLILACVSAHGFGHGSRTASVLAELAKLRPDWRLVLSTALPASFLELALGPVPHEQRRCRWDVGVIQADALGADPAATLEALEQVERALPGQLEREAAWLVQQGEPALVLGDVPPAAARLASRTGLPLVWLASFGWDAIYGPMAADPQLEPEQAERFAGWAEHCRTLYRRGDLLLRCPLAMPMPWDLPERAIGLTSSSPRLDLADLAERLQLPPDRQRCVLISFGGMGFPLDPALLAHWPEHVFLGPDPAMTAAPNGRLLPPGVRPLDAMPLIGRLITKPGYSSFCEALSQNVGIHLVHREGFAEAAVLEADLQRIGWHRLLSQEQLRSGDWQLDQPLLPPSGTPLPTQGAAEAAAAIVTFAEERSAVPMYAGHTIG
ncbi:hypothetical protein [Synechococcus sp. CS-1328]|uniref:hypothetical protein n=1 Tax=Synechococcus sp. CS-1328 TaxID=2847976 RepID=UPI002880BD2E|nr:hypothetical protein [Synechococcus sp. CS-1328]